MNNSFYTKISISFLLQKIVNIFCISFNLFFITQIYSSVIKKPVWSESYLILCFFAPLIFEFLNQKNELLGYNLVAYIKKTLIYWFISIFFILGLTFFIKGSDLFSRVSIGIWFITTPFFIIFFTSLNYKFLNFLGIKKRKKTKVVILGAGELGINFLRIIENNPWLGFEVVGFYDDKVKSLKDINQAKVKTKIKIKTKTKILGSLKKAHSDAKACNWQRAFIALPLRYEKKINSIVNSFNLDTSVLVDIIPDVFRYQLFNPEWNIIDNIPIITLHSNPIKGLNSVIKKVEDISLSIVILIIISPLFLSIALAIKLTSRGPIFFIQERFGINGKLIRVYKFRSMYVNQSRQEGIDVKKDDKAVTPLGKIIRKTSLDELPQFINVLQNKMSIVGPRPHAKAFNDKYKKIAPSYMKRHFIKPGITGWAQVNGYRGEASSDDKILKRTQYDLFYINNWSLYFDLKIIFLTIVKGFINKNAY